MTDPQSILSAIRSLASTGNVKLTRHAQEEMVAEAVTVDDLLHVIGTACVLEDYPAHRRGACCLLYGTDRSGRDVHVVCTTANPVLIIITVYLPRPPKWISATQRRATT